MENLGPCARLVDWDNNLLRAGWSVDQIQVGGKIFCIRPDQRWGPPSLIYNGYWVIAMVWQ
jgi:hypothetical protein